MSLAAEKGKQLKEKRAELAALFEKHRGGDGKFDAETPIAEIRQRNEELNRLAAEWQAARDADPEFLAGIEARNAEELGRLSAVERLPAGGTEADPGFARREGGGRPSWGPGKSFGQEFVESRAFKGFEGGPGPTSSLKIDLRTLMTTAAGFAPESTRTGRVELFPTQPGVLDFMPTARTEMAAVVYMEETTFTNSAAETAEAGTYPEAALAFTQRTSTVRKIPVFLPVTDEQLEDVPFLRDYVDQRLRFMLRQRLGQQILVGDGIAPNLLGLANVPGILTQAKGADAIPSAIYKLMTKIRAQGFAEPDLHVLNPTDWQTIRLLQDANGNYLWGHPSQAGPDRLWGLPVVTTTHLTQGTGISGAFQEFAQLVYRRDIDVQISNSHSTFFVEGKQAIRADLRVACIYYRPRAFGTTTGL